MPTKPIKRFTAWSFSRLNNYRKCPFRAKLVYLDKVAEPEGPALVGGHEAHTQAENYIKKPTKVLPSRLLLFKQEFLKLTKQPVVTEAQWGFDSLWRPTDWFHPDTWVRVVIDAYYIVNKTSAKKVAGLVSGSTVVIIDYKTGKIREESKEQLGLYALAAFSKFPLADEVEAQFWYLDQGEIVKLVFFRKDVPAMMKEWAAKVVPMLNDRRFAPRPGDYCRWCPHSKVKGGKCKF